MSEQRLRKALTAILADMPVLCCEYLHHSTKDRHRYDEECPVEKRLNAAMTEANAAVSQKKPKANHRATVSNWQPIETAPRDGKNAILLHTRYGLIYCGRWRDGQIHEPQAPVWSWRCDSSGRFANPTHWMPLPNPPEGNQ